MREEKIIKIVSKMEKAYSNKYPFSIQCAILDKCFNRCIMCDHPLRPQFEIDFKGWKKFLCDASAGGLESVCYSGGDPMAYKNINEVMEAHIEYNILYGFIISGFVPSNIKTELLKYASWVRVSLDTVDPILYDKIRGKLKLSKVLDCISKMKSDGVKVELAPTVHNDNYNAFHQVLEYALENKLPVHVKTVHEYTYGFDKVNWEKIKKYQEIFDSNDVILNIYGHDEYVKFNRCHAVQYQCFIDSKGDIYPCSIQAGDTDSAPNMNPLGNIRNWDSYLTKQKEFNSLTYGDLPDKCQWCQARLSKLNNICDTILKSNDEKAFY